MKKLILVLLFILSIQSFYELSADGCYFCGSGSGTICRDYCGYSGSDTSENRKKM